MRRRGLARRYGHSGRRLEKLDAQGRIRREKDRIYFIDKGGKPASVLRKGA